MRVTLTCRRAVAAIVSAALVVAGATAVAPVSAAGEVAAKAAANQSDNVSSRRDLVSARIAAASQNSRVEVTSLDDEYSTTYVNPDGTETTDTSQTPLRVMQNGAWTPVDYTLEHVGGGWQPAASPVPVVFSDGADADAAQIGGGAKEVDLSWDVTLPKPNVDGAVATYDLGGGESLVLTATSTGFEQSLVLSQAPTSLPHIKLPLDTADLTMTSDGNGGFAFQNAGGKDVYEMPGPVMYGAKVDPDTGEPAESKAVSANLVQTADGPRLDLAPSMSWLQDPSTTYPVTIDPSVNSVGRGDDSYIQDNVTTSQSSAIFLHAGEFNGHASRSYLLFSGVANYAGKDIIKANLSLWNTGANSCTPATMHVYALTSAFKTTDTWSNPKPTWTTTDGGSQSFASGISGCPNAEVDIPVQKIMQDWANGQANDGLQLSGTETANSQGWAFCSMNLDTTNGSSCTATPNHQPTLSVTYYSYPAAPATTSMRVYPCSVPCSGTGTNTAPTNTTTPQLGGVASDADGGNITDEFQIFSGTIANPGSTVITSGSAPATSGSTATWRVPAGSLTNGGTYVYRVRGVNGTANGPYSGYFAFLIDTTAPAAPTLSSALFSAGQWNNPSSGTLSWASSPDVVQYKWALNSGASGVTTGNTGSHTFSNLQAGANTITVQAIDKAGNISTAASEIIGVGAAAIGAPAENDNTQQNVTISSPSSQGGLGMPPYVAYEWRYGSTGSFAPISLGNITPMGTAPSVSSWPIASSGSYTWNVASSVGNKGDGNVQVEGCYGSSSTSISTTCQLTPVDVELDADAFQDADATEQVGPGMLADLTGDYDIDATDVDAFGDTLSRSLTTLKPVTSTNSLTDVFGPGWTASLDGPSDGAASDTVTFSAPNGLVTLTNSEGSQTDFTDPVVTAAGVTTYTDPDDDTQTMTYSSSGQTQLTYSGGGGDPTITEWVPGTGSSWQPSAVVENKDTAQNTADYFYKTTAPLAGMLQAITTPSAPNVDCSTLAKAIVVEGCRTMELNYTILDNAAAGQVRLSEVDMALWDPTQSKIVTTPVAKYSYDDTKASGLLLAEWDPRISPALKTAYTYDSNGRLQTLTPPGLATWTFAYNSSGQLIAVSRPDPSGKPAVTTIVYGLPLTGSGLPDLSSGSQGPSSWGQVSDLPVAGSATAVFPPSHQPAGTDLSHISSTDWPYAAITYLDVDGQDVDDAAYSDSGWQVGSTQYDSYGNTIWSLDPQGRNQARNPTANTDPFVAAQSPSSQRASLLASTSTYSADGSEDLSDLGPMHPVTVNVSGQQSVVDARAHTVTCYDDNSTACTGETEPANAAPGLTMSTTTSVQDANSTDYNSQTTTKSYEAVDGGASGWDLGEPTAVTDPGGLTTITGYNADGTIKEVDQPSTAGANSSTAARSQLITYYTAPTSGSDDAPGCLDAAWVGQVCKIATKSTSAELPVTTYTYDAWGDQVAKTQTYGTGGSAVLRGYSETYDPAGRQLTRSISVTPDSAGGIDVPTVTYGYDPSTGLPTTSSTGTGNGNVTLTNGYDNLGDVTKYTDATGNVSTTGYDLDQRVISLNDGKGTTTYGYGPDSGDQDEVTSENIGVSGAPSMFAANFDADGNLTSETYPNGLVAASTYDNAGEQTDLSYTMSGASWLDFGQTFNAQGQVVNEFSPESTQTFAYDGSGRLTQVQDNDNSTGAALCTTRQYVYDNDSNRTRLNSYPDSGSGCSTSTVGTKTDYQYDAVDQLSSDTAGTYRYDGLGRTILVPGADAIDDGTPAAPSSSNLTVGYYANDMVASESHSTAALSFALDPNQGRIVSTANGAKTTINHYSDDDDSPSWTSTDATHWSENFLGPDGGMAAEADQGGSVALELPNLHGDIVATCTDSASITGVSAYAEATEFGVPRNPSGALSPYGWLGSDERSTNDLGGMSLMGVRLYNPETSRFLSTDPIDGGNANAYIYPTDPINSRDLSGKMVIKCGIITCTVYLTHKTTRKIADAGIAGTLALLRKFPSALADALLLYAVWFDYEALEAYNSGEDLAFRFWQVGEFFEAEPFIYCGRWGVHRGFCHKP